MKFSRYFLIFAALLSSQRIMCQKISDDTVVTGLAAVSNYKNVMIGSPSDDKVVSGLGAVSNYKIDYTGKIEKAQGPGATAQQTANASATTAPGTPTTTQQQANAAPGQGTGNPPVQRKLMSLKSNWVPGKPVYLRDHFNKNIKNTREIDEKRDIADTLSELSDNFANLKDKGQTMSGALDKGLII